MLMAAGAAPVVMAVGAGVREVWIDPGIGFGKTESKSILERVLGADKVAEPAAEKPVRKDPPPKRGKKNHPIVPSWEDVLLGVRSNR